MKKIYAILWFLVLTHCICSCTGTGNVLEKLNNIQSKTSDADQQKAVQDLLTRLFPAHVEDFVLVVNKTQFNLKNNLDAFEYEYIDGKIHVSGTTGVALATGLYHYLKYFCNVHVSWSGDQLKLPEKLPIVPARVTKTFSERFRYYQNVCTVSYSSPFWDWARWEKEIDWMALNGINFPLAFTGQEAIWQIVYKEMGLTQPELDEHFSGAAFLAWQRMGNLDGWGGPLPVTWHSRQLVLQNNILKRMRSFGIIPVLPGFAGHVPKALVRRLHPNAKYTNSSVWVGFGNQYKTVLLDPLDPLFKQVGMNFIKKQIELYNGTDHVYNADVFNEMDPPSAKPEYMSNISASIFQTLEAGDPGAVWLMQGWQFLSGFWTNPLMMAWFKAVPLGRLILLDLAAELEPVYSRTDGFFGHPFIWCMIENFGGNTRMYGSTDDVINGIQSARAKFPNQMVGIGSTPEGINQNHINFELLYEMSWRGDEHMQRFSWMNLYIKRRYQDNYGHATEAWDMLYKDVYNSHHVQNGGGSQGRVTVTRPYVTDKLPTILWYDPKDVFQTWQQLTVAAKFIGISDPLRHDLVKIGTQCIEDLMGVVYPLLIAGYKNQSIFDVYIRGKMIDEMLNDMDELLSTDAYSLLGVWIESAKAFGGTPAEKLNMEYNARNQITLWGPDGQIEDYANKNWAGLVKTYYAGRWQMFTRELSNCVRDQVPYNNTKFREELMVFEKQWCADTSPYPTKPHGDVLEISERLSEKYGNMLEELGDEANKEWGRLRKRTAYLMKMGTLTEIKKNTKKRRYGLKKRFNEV